MALSPKETCYHDLERRILATELAPGEDLDEAGLCQAYGISRTPLREVLQRMAGDGLVTLAPNRGAKVASMDLQTMRTFFQTAPMVYSSIARLAAENRTEAQLAALRVAQDEFMAAKSPREAAFANHRFHAQIGEMAANPYLLAALSRLLIDHTRLSQTFYSPLSDTERELVALATEQHEMMFDAIARRDADAAVEVTLKHWDLSRDRIERYVRPDPLPLEFSDAV
ncbi:MAG: GntR family transcriptional regulator [Pseudomonadota bacterium]